MSVCILGNENDGGSNPIFVALGPVSREYSKIQFTLQVQKSRMGVNTSLFFW